MRDVSYSNWKPPNLDKIQQLASQAGGFGYGAAGFGDVGYSQHGLIARAEREAHEKQLQAEAERRKHEEREREEREERQRKEQERLHREELRREEERRRKEALRQQEEEAEERRRAQKSTTLKKVPQAAPAPVAPDAPDVYSDDDVDDDFEVVDLDTLDVEDFVIVREDFISDSEGGEELLRGQRGQIVEVDEDGDAYIRFRDHRKKQWVYSENLPYLAKVLFDKGDILHVRRSFHCGSFHIRRGQMGVAKRLDAGGDLLVEFDRNVGDQWVQYYSLVFMEKEKPAESSGPSKQKASAEARVWLYNPPAFRDVAVRATPDIDGPRTQVTLRPGQRFMVSEEHVGTDGVRYLKLADGSGWMFENKPGAGVLCVRQNGGMPGDLLSRLSDKTPPDDKLLHEEDAKAFLMHMHRILNSKQVRPAVEGLQRELPDRIRSVTEVQKSQETQLTIEKAKRILIDACKSLFKDFGFQVSQEGQQELLEALREHESCNLVYIMATSVELVLQIPPGGWFGLSQLRRGFQVVVKQGGPSQLVGKRGVLLKRDGAQWQVRLDGVDEAQLLLSEDLVIAPDPNAVKEASKAKEIKASASEKELEMEAWQMASLAAVRGKGHGKQLTEAPWWAVCQDRASRRATGRLAERELLAIASGSEASWSESLKRPNKSLPPAPLPIEDERVPSVFAIIEEIEADENRDRVRNEFKALARRRKPQPQAVAAVAETAGGSSASSGRRRGAFSTRAGALEEKAEAAETFLDAEEEQDSDDLRTAEARANRGDIRDLLRREKFACSRKDAELAVMTGKLDRNPGRIAVEGRNEELPPRRTRPQCVKEEFERQRARWHMPPRGKHVGFMPQAHVLGTGQGNLGALEDGASSATRRRADKDLLAPNFGGLPEFDDQPGFFRGSGFASFG